MGVQIKVKSSLYSQYYAEACNEWRGPSPQLSAWATQLRSNDAAVASLWRLRADLTGPGIEPQTYRTDSVRTTADLTGRSYRNQCKLQWSSQLLALRQNYQYTNPVFCLKLHSNAVH